MATLYETKRLHVRRWQENDATDLFELLTSDVFEFLDAYGWKPLKTKADAKSIAKYWNEDKKHPLCPSTRTQYAIALKTGKVIGTLGLSERDHDGINVGFILNSNFKGNGYATETLKGVIAHLEARGLKTLSYTSIGNVVAQRVMEKAGMKYQHEAKLDDLPFVTFAVYSV